MQCHVGSWMFCRYKLFPKMKDFFLRELRANLLRFARGRR